ncbi:MAG TPA: P22 phage major capsid protein family protein [Hyphomicrobiaceae bacterium]|nr:P22 phage major capsid protein family protein [Hyphomicrobiaceae bacterium]
MADTTLTADVIAKAALASMENEIGWLGEIYRAPEEEFSKEVNGYKIGSTVNIRRPHDPRPRTGATMDLKNVIEGKVDFTVDKQIGHDFQFTSSDLALNITDLTKRVIKPAMINIVGEMARDVAEQMYQGFYNWVGTPGQTINSFSDFAKGPERLTEMSVPMADRIALLSPSDNWGMIGSQTSLFNSGLVGDAYKEGQLGRVGGVNTFESQVVPTHTNGTWDATTPLTDGDAQNVTYDTAKNTWTQTLVTDGWDASATITAGSVFTIAGVYMVNAVTKASTGILQQFVVTSAVTANATTTSDTNLTISPPIITSGPHQTVTYSGSFDGLAITPVGSASTGYKQNMMFHKNAMALAVVPLAMPEGAVGGSRQSYKGFSCRVQPVYDGLNDVSAWRLDILYGRKLIDPRLGLRISGTA